MPITLSLTERPAAAGKMANAASQSLDSICIWAPFSALSAIGLLSIAGYPPRIAVLSAAITALAVLFVLARVEHTREGLQPEGLGSADIVVQAMFIVAMQYFELVIARQQLLPHSFGALNYFETAGWHLAAIVVLNIGCMLLVVALEGRAWSKTQMGRRSEDRNRAIDILDEQGVTRSPNRLLSKEIQQRRRMEAELYHLAYHDSLTGLGNRAHLMAAIKQRMDDLNSNVKAGKFLLYIDLDKFKAVNDLAGHRVGEEFLKEIARRLQMVAGEDDVLVRMGGDEFAILFHEIDQPARATRIAERILGLIAEPADLDGMHFPVTASIGICEIHTRYSDGEELLRDVETAMYRAKQNGGDCYAIYDSGMYDEALSVIQTTLQLRSAIDHSEFELYYQPMVDMRDLSIIGVESLIRWKHPTRGVLAPGAFIRVAEETGYIVQMGAWALQQICADIQTIKRRLRRDLILSINVSSRQLDDPSFLSRIVSLVEHCEISPAFLQLEITESIFLKDADRIGAIFREIRSMGVKLALDDFGTGYSSLSYLQKFPIDTLKIDRSFVQGMHDGPLDFGIVRFLIDLARSAGIRLVAEGIEEESQASAILALGCHLAQGHLYSEPLPLGELLDLIENGLNDCLLEMH